MNPPVRPLRKAVRIMDGLLDIAVVILVLILLSYSAYSIWFTRSLTDGSFLSDKIAQYKPTGQSPTLEDLMELNPDVRSWLTVDGTNIDYPVVQGATDTEYLNKSVMGEFSLAGSIFLTTGNSPDFTDAYNMVYGHHIEGGAMFSDVMNFRFKDYFDSHLTGTLWLSDKTFRIELFACMEIDALDPVIYQLPRNVTHELLPEVVGYILEKAVQKRDVVIDSEDSIIVMSTCKDPRGFDRCLLFGKLIPLSKQDSEKLEAENLKQQEDQKARAEKPVERGIAIDPYIVLPVVGSALVFLFLIILLIRRRNNKGKSKKQ